MEEELLKVVNNNSNSNNCKKKEKNIEIKIIVVKKIYRRTVGVFLVDFLGVSVIL